MGPPYVQAGDTAAPAVPDKLLRPPTIGERQHDSTRQDFGKSSATQPRRARGRRRRSSRSPISVHAAAAPRADGQDIRKRGRKSWCPPCCNHLQCAHQWRCGERRRRGRSFWNWATWSAKVGKGWKAKRKRGAMDDEARYTRASFAVPACAALSFRKPSSISRSSRFYKSRFERWGVWALRGQHQTEAPIRDGVPIEDACAGDAASHIPALRPPTQSRTGLTKLQSRIDSPSLHSTGRSASPPDTTPELPS